MSAYDLDDFRAALSVQYLFWALGITQILRYRRRGLAHLRRSTPAPSRRCGAASRSSTPASATTRVSEP